MSPRAFARKRSARTREGFLRALPDLRNPIFLGMLTVLIGSTGAFAQQQQKPPKPAATQTGCPSGYDNCVKGGMKMGYSQTEAGGYCTRRCGRK